MLGSLRNLGPESKRIVPIAFHVDYFNKPWKDRFSDPSHSQRELSYNRALKRDDLYFTPMMMVDGRYPMLGSDRPKALSALRRTLSAAPAAALRLAWDGAAEERRRTLRVSATPTSSSIDGRETMIGVAIQEDPVTTRVESGENAGKTLTERFAVRKFLWKTFKARRGRPQTETFPLELGNDWDAEKCGVAVWVQDWNDGRVHQADALPWTPEEPTRSRSPSDLPRGRSPRSVD